MTLPSRSSGDDRQLSQLPHFLALERFAEISEQVGPPAARGFGQTDKRLQLGTETRLNASEPDNFSIMRRVLHDIRQAVCHPGAGTAALTPASISPAT